jgi:Flp pilus assembly protein TadD
VLFLVVAALAATAGCDSTSAVNAKKPIPASVPSVARGTEFATAKTAFEAGSFGYAARYFEMALEAAPRSMDACLGLAASYDWLSRFTEADKTYGKCRTIGGETVAYHNNRGFSYLLRGEHGLASVSLAQAQALSPDNPTVANNLRILRDVSSG